jgi:hypothetical protein
MKRLLPVGVDRMVVINSVGDGRSTNPDVPPTAMSRQNSTAKTEQLDLMFVWNCYETPRPEASPQIPDGGMCLRFGRQSCDRVVGSIDGKGSVWLETNQGTGGRAWGNRQTAGQNADQA